MKKPNPQNVIGGILIVVFVVLAVGLAAALAMVFAPVELTLDEESYTLSFFIYHEESAPYSEIEEIALLDENYTSERIKSYGGISKDFGTYRNDDYGEHFRLTFAENKYAFIMIRRTDGSVTVFNQKTVAATEELYAKLAERVTSLS